MVLFDSEALIRWFTIEQRDLPWRYNRTPYSVWVSEMMLQQTQVSVVIPYFLRWMERFPTIEALAESSIEEVIKLWEGLGYYSRARFLYEGAKQIVKEFEGKFPETIDQLRKIKGIGVYTAGAISSFAFKQKESAIDGNVLRVLSRYFEIKEDISKPTTLKKMQILVKEFLPEDSHWLLNEGLIELGATICSKSPKCSICPIKRSCGAFLKGSQENFPVKSLKIKSIFLHRVPLVLFNGEKVLVRKTPKGEIMQDLYEFPYLELPVKPNQNEVLEVVSKKFSIRDFEYKLLREVSHSFTKYRVKLYPYFIQSKEINSYLGYEWIESKFLKDLPFSSGHKKVLLQAFN